MRRTWIMSIPLGDARGVKGVEYFSLAASTTEAHRSVRYRDPDRRDRTLSSPYFATSASQSVHPVGVRQHVEAHQSQNYEHNHGGHHPHYAHFGFFFLLILVCHGFLLFFSSVALALIWRSYNVLGNLIIPAYSSLTEQFATAAPTKQQDAVTLLHSKPAHPWTLEQLAREVGLSRSSFAERFMHFVGQPPMHYLTQ